MRNVYVSRVLPIAALGFVLQGCGESNPTTPSGTGGSAGNGGASPIPAEPPNYAKAFPQDTVARIDITISAENWKIMRDDMTSMLGEFGTSMNMGGPGGGGGGGGGPGGPGGMMPPPELIEACNGLAAGDACMATFMGLTLTGKCSDLAGSLTCFPEGGPGGPGGPGGDGSVDLLPRTPVYAECDVKTDDQAWSHVGIRFKGNSSLAMSWGQGVWKLPLRLNFDKHEDTYPETKNQRFYGFDGLSLSNGANDSSLLRDKIGTEVFVNAGIAAPATAFYRVYIDHGEGPTYFGLYTGIEIPEDESFMDTHFGGHKGNLYKPDGVGARWQTWDPNTLGKENNEDEADFSDAQALFEALHADRTDAAVWRAGLEARLDVDGFLHWLALNAVIEDWDQYGRMPHNYYLYSDPKANGKFTWIPWDHSFAFPDASGGGIGSQALSLSMSEITEQWPLIRFLLDDPVYLDVYRGYVAQAVKKEYEAVAMEKRFTAAHDLITPYVTGEFKELPGYTFLSSPAAFDNGLAGVITHAKQRKADVDVYVGP